MFEPTQPAKGDEFLRRARYQRRDLSDEAEPFHSSILPRRRMLSAETRRRLRDWDDFVAF